MTSAFEPINTGIAAHLGTYADAVRILPGAELIYTSGTPGLRPDGTVPEDFTEEATLAWRNVEAALGRAGARLSDIVSVRQWLTDAADIPAYAAVRSWMIRHQPVFTLAVVPAMIWPNIRIQVEVTAVRRPAML